MTESADQHERAFRHLVHLLEEAAKAGATAVGLKREEQDLMVVHYFKSMGRAEAPIPPDMEEAVIEEIVKRAGLADQSKGVMSVVLLGKDYDVVVDQTANWGESEFTLTLKKGRQTEEDYDFDDEVDDHLKEPTPTLTRQKVGRNDPCPCGSGKKFKKCCLKKQDGHAMLE